MNLLSTGSQSELHKHQTMTNAAFTKIHLRLWLIALSLTRQNSALPRMVSNTAPTASLPVRSGSR